MLRITVVKGDGNLRVLLNYLDSASGLDDTATSLVCSILEATNSRSAA